MFDRPLEMRVSGDSLTLVGSVDEYSLPDLRRQLETMVDAGGNLVIELSGVDFLPSAGIGLLARASSRARRQGGDVTLVCAEGSPAQRILAVTGVEYRSTPA